jgi:hypothetical protein
LALPIKKRNGFHFTLEKFKLNDFHVINSWLATSFETFLSVGEVQMEQRIFSSGLQFPGISHLFFNEVDPSPSIH